MPPDHPDPLVQRVDTVLRNFTQSPRGTTVLHINDTRVVMRPRGNEPTLVMQARICKLPRHSAPRAALCEALLMANTHLSDSDRVGIDPVDHTVVYQRVVDISLDAEALGDELWDLIEAADQLKHGLGRD